jgi:hypothetical protein
MPPKSKRQLRAAAANAARQRHQQQRLAMEQADGEPFVPLRSVPSPQRSSQRAHDDGAMRGDDEAELSEDDGDSNSERVRAKRPRVSAVVPWRQLLDEDDDDDNDDDNCRCVPADIDIVDDRVDDGDVSEPSAFLRPRAMADDTPEQPARPDAAATTSARRDARRRMLQLQRAGGAMTTRRCSADRRRLSISRATPRRPLRTSRPI